MEVGQIGSQTRVSCFTSPMRSVLSPRLAVYEESEGIGIDLEKPSNLAKASPLFVETLDLSKFPTGCAMSFDS